MSRGHHKGDEVQSPRGGTLTIHFSGIRANLTFLLGCPVGAPGDNQSTLGGCSLERKLRSFPCHKIVCNFRKGILISHSHSIKTEIIILLIKSCTLIKALQVLRGRCCRNRKSATPLFLYLAVLQSFFKAASRPA